MAKDFNLSVVAPDRTVVDESVSSVIVPSVMGYMGIMADHEPAIIALKMGLLEYRDSSGSRRFVAIGGGFVEVSGEKVIVLADDARQATDIDIKAEEAAIEKARAALRGEDSAMTSGQAVEEIEKAMNRLKIAKMG